MGLVKKLQLNLHDLKIVKKIMIKKKICHFLTTNPTKIQLLTISSLAFFYIKRIIIVCNYVYIFNKNK